MKAQNPIGAVLYALFFLAALGAFAQPPGSYVHNEFLVKFRSGVGRGEVQRIAWQNGARLLAVSPLSGVSRISVPHGRSVAQMVQALRNNPNVVYAEPDYIAHEHAAALYPTDPLYSPYQWNMDTGPGGIDMPEAWAWMQANSPGGNPGGDPSVVVAVLDTGVAYENYSGKNKHTSYYQAPDLSQTHFVPGWDFVNNDSHPDDDEGHGTHVAGTIAESTTFSGPGYGVAGIASGVSIMPVKVLDATGSGTYAEIANGIYFATDNGADVINMSLGGSMGSTTLKNALAYAYNAGVTIVCSAGNNSGGAVDYPAAYDAYCIAVSATDYYGHIAPYSSIGPQVDIAAPGGDLSQDANGDGYGDGILQQTFGRSYGDFNWYFYQGTSMAAPHVSGVAALLISSGVYGPVDVRAALEDNATDEGAPGVDNTYGHGLLNAYAALTGTHATAPDVEVDIPSPPTAVLGGTETDVAVDVANLGSADASNVLVTFTDAEGGTVSPASQTIASLGAGQSTTLSFAWTPSTVTTPETHTLRADATAAGDNNPSNDAASLSVLVTQFGTDIAVLGINAPDSTTVDQTEGIDVTVANQGITDQSFSLMLDDGSGDSALSQDLALPAGEQTVVTFSWTAPNTAGEYTLTAAAQVSDDNEADNSATATVTVNDQQSIHVSGIDMELHQRGVFSSAKATVSIANSQGTAVSGANVAVDWGGAVTGSDSALTDSNGQVVLTSPSVKKAPSGTVLTVTVTSVSKAGTLYDPSANTPMPVSVSVP